MSVGVTPERRGLFGARLMQAPGQFDGMPLLDRPGVQANVAAALAGQPAPVAAPMSAAMPAMPPAQALPAARAPARPGFNDAGGLGDQFRTLAGHMMQMGGMEGAGRSLLDEVQQRGAALARLKQQQAEWDHDAATKAGDRAYEASKPDYFTVGRDRVRYDPTTQATTSIYSAPLDAEAYADALGYQPGSPDYQTALQDFTLRGNGPTAYGYDVGLEDERQGNREDLEGLRYRNRASLRSQPTYRDLNPRSARGGGAGGGGGGGGGRVTMAGTIAPLVAKMARGEPLTPGEQQALAVYRPGRGGRGGGGAGTGAAPVRVGSAAEAAKLPSGTRFVGPDGQERVRR